jgi:predicted nuclease of predicted toxin-antitoxin system
MILLDNCVPRRYLRLLQSWSYQAELSTVHIAADASDVDVIALAQTLDAVLFTIDLDFANILDYPPKNYAGIMVMRYNVSDEAEVDKTLQIVLQDLYRDDLRGVLVIIAPGRYRIRQ